MESLKWNIHHFRCTQCKRELIPFNLNSVNGKVDGVSVTFRNLPCLACPEQHEKWPAHPDFMEELLDFMFQKGGIPTVRQKGLLRKKPFCPICKNELAQPARHFQFKACLRLNLPGSKYEVEIVSEKAKPTSTSDPAVFFVELISPALNCARCGVPVSLFGSGLLSPIRKSIEEFVDLHLKGKG